MKLKLWPFFIVEFRTYAVKYQIRNKYHELCNKMALWLNRPFKDKHLKYAASGRCRCGAGLAYPKGLPYAKGLDQKFNYWDCSAILTGKIEPEKINEKDSDDNYLHPRYPFAFYDIKSEDQPSAFGATTRPKNVVTYGDSK